MHDDIRKLLDFTGQVVRSIIDAWQR